MNFMTWTSLFWINRKIQLIINRHNNKKREIKTGICQGFLVSPIFFLIYISKIFNKVLKTSFLIIFLLFIDDLSFIALSSSVKEILKARKKVA